MDISLVLVEESILEKIINIFERYGKMETKKTAATKTVTAKKTTAKTKKNTTKHNLVIVESPAKAKTIEKILGSNFLVTASFGHIRDLAKSNLSIDIENNFEPKYSSIKGKGDVIKSLRALAKKSDKVYLASDPDREGEAIAWHIAHTLKLNEEDNNRIEFNEITPTAIREAIKNPRKVDMDKVNAQQARRILDRLVGYEVSPLLWKTTSGKTSAGRVQSVALKLICELEDVIQAFIPEKYWDVKGNFENNINLALYKVNDEKIDKLKDEEVVKKIESLLKENFIVDSSKVTKKSKNPPLPLKTSTLQQLASSYLGFGATKTMRVAQGLYEGINIKGSHKGLITYMRTDSVRISDDAVKMASDYILSTYGKEYLGGSRSKTKKQENIQDAHEAVRPTDVTLTPDSIKEYLDADQQKLYKLIWERFVISQLAPMKYEQFELLTSKDGIQFRGILNKILFDGYYILFKDEEDIPLGDFPDIKENQNIKLEKLNIKEDYTKPPARLTESSLIKKLESDGIGRPSTYASIVNTLKEREYVTLNGKSFIPTELGYQVKEILNENFKNFMNIKFTSNMEDKLDEIAEGKENWKNLLGSFYGELEKNIEKYKKIIGDEENRTILSDVPCSCGEGYMVLKNGRYGRYLACSNEDCKENISLKGITLSVKEIQDGKIFVKDLVAQKQAEKKGKPTDVIGESLAPMLLKLGRFGSYLESENYANDNLRMPLPPEIRKALAQDEVSVIDGVVQLRLRLKVIWDEEKAILDKAGVCDKCGSPYRIGRGRWGKYLACTAYPNCKNIKNLDADGNIVESKGEGKKTATKKGSTTKKTTTRKTSTSTAKKATTTKKTTTAKKTTTPKTTKKSTTK